MLPTSNTGRLIWAVFWLVLIVQGACSQEAAAQSVQHCEGPAELERALAAQPLAAAYDALGA
jgi:hypothetical protein